MHCYYLLMLQRTIAVHCTTVYCSTVLQQCTVTTFYCSTVLKHYSLLLLLHYTAALYYSSALLLIHSFVALHCSIALYYILLQHCIASAHCYYYILLQHCTEALQSTEFYCSSVLNKSVVYCLTPNTPKWQMVSLMLDFTLPS